jgi:universal stress protein E
MTSKERVLVIVDPTAATQPALERGAWLAQRMGWSLELLICIHGGLPSRWHKAVDPKATRRALLAHQLGYLRDLARGVDGLEISNKAVWDRPLHEAIIRETLRSEPRLVMKDTHYHSAISRALITNTDWHLIRDCPAPLWLVRGPAWPAKPTIVACVDPAHENDKPAELDHRILGEARRLAEATGGRAHAVHCYDPAPLVTGAGAAVMPGAAIEIENLAAGLQAEHAARLNELASAHGLMPAETHFRSGAPEDGIPAAVRQLAGDLVVMGAVSRSRLQQAMIGSTAERVLDQLPCDVLVLKPARFDSPAAYRAQAPDFMELH